MHIVAIASQKGGVGKTTSAVNLAAAYAEQGRRVLLVDLDPQGHSSFFVGMRVQADGPTRRMLGGRQNAAEAARPTPFGFDLVAGGRDVAAAELELQANHGITAVADALTPCPQWDLVICDCPPSLGMLSSAALFAAHVVLVPMVLQKLPLDGLGQLRETIGRIRRLNPALRVGAVFGVNSDPRTLLARAVIDAVKAIPDFGGFAETLIRRDTELGKAVGHAPITSYAPQSNGAADYRALAKELVSMGAVP